MGKEKKSKEELHIEIGDGNEIKNSNIDTSKKGNEQIVIGDDNRISNLSIGGESKTPKKEHRIFWLIVVPFLVSVIGGVIVVWICHVLGLSR